jgi:hypothetical protein
VPGQILAFPPLDLRDILPTPVPGSFRLIMQVNFQRVYGSGFKRDRSLRKAIT